MNFSAKKFHIKFPYVLIIILTFVGMIISFLPLVGELGYENSAVNSFLLFVLTGIYSIHYFKKENNGGSGPLTFILNAKINLSAFILIPFVFAFLSTLLFSKCPLSDGILFYIILVIPSLFLGFVCGYFSFVLSKKYSYILFFVIFFFLVFVSLSEFYFNPQVYFYNPVIGFFPGTIYDEDLKVDYLLFFYRTINIFFGFVLLYISFNFLNKSIVRRMGLGFFTLIAVVVFYFIKPAIGFSTSISRLEKNLKQSIQTEHFFINYSKPEKDFVDPMLLGLLHEYYYDQVINELQIKSNNKIRSFIFFDSKQKRELFGAGNANVAKPWLNHIYLNYDNYEVALKHELVHVLAGQFGVTPFKVADNINPAMIEGIAMAIENNFDGYSIHYAAKLAYQAGYKITIKNLFSGLNFFSQFSSISYLYSGSFIKFLIDNYGIDKIKMLYADSDFKRIFGKDIPELENEYFTFLDSIQINFNRNKAQLYFAGQPIFKKFCPRIAASQTNKAWEFFNSKEYEKAFKIFNEVYAFSDSYQSLRGKINSLIKLNRAAEAEQILTTEINKFKSSRYYYYLELMLADLFIRNDQSDKAIMLYDTLLVQAPHVDYVNNVLLKKEFYNEGVDSLKRYITSETKDKFEMLTRLNQRSVRYFSIPTLLGLCSDSSQVRQICSDFNKIIVTDYYSSYASLKLSMAAVLLNDFTLAKDFAVKSLAFKDDQGFIFNLSQNLKMINWLNNYADEIKPYFVYR